MSKYDKHDIKMILNRAAELQQRASGSGPPSGHDEKLTLEEIEEIAREAGVSADYVEAAALEYEGIPVKEPLFLNTGNKQELKLIGYARGKLNKKHGRSFALSSSITSTAPEKYHAGPKAFTGKPNPRVF